MRKKNNIKRHINLNLIIIFLLIIFLIKSDFFRNLYFLNQDGYTKIDTVTVLKSLMDFLLI